MMPVLHQKLAELGAYENHPMVIEAPYAYFLNPAKAHHYTAGFYAKAIGELHALHPNLWIIVGHLDAHRETPSPLPLARALFMTPPCLLLIHKY